MAVFRDKHPSSPQKLCIACKEPIPADAKICFHCRASQEPEKNSLSKNALKWIGSITAVIGLITALSGVVGPLKGWWSQGRHSQTMLAAGQKQAELGEYAAAFDTYSDLLKSDPNNVAATHARLDVAMLWIEDFRVTGKDEQEIAQKASELLARIGTVLEAGLTTHKGYREADVIAHLAWLNLLKTDLTEEDAEVEKNLQRALSMDPTNVYANAMMGEWILEKHLSVEDARKRFDIALQTGKARGFVRRCQLESLVYNEKPGARAELIRVINQMRKDGDDLSDADRGRIHSYYYGPTLGSEDELREVLSAVPPDEEWATYRWIDRPLTEWEPFTPEQQQFIQARLDEVAGKRDEALKIYRQLDVATKKSPGTFADRIHAGEKRLAH
jgi:tetratricopeptide (TPR) repeat protein